MLRIVQTYSSILPRTRERLPSLTYSVVAFSSPYSSLETLQACSQQTGGASAKRRCTSDGMWETQGVEEDREEGRMDRYTVLYSSTPYRKSGCACVALQSFLDARHEPSTHLPSPSPLPFLFLNYPHPSPLFSPS
jgi:hypothetical protein